MWNHSTHPKSEEYTTTCRMLVTKYPTLRDNVGNEYVSSNYPSIHRVIYNVLSGFMENSVKAVVFEPTKAFKTCIRGGGK